MRFSHAFATTASLLAAAIFFVGCSTNSPADPMDVLLNSVRQATQQYASSGTAAAAGYAADPHCVAHPTAGGMGAHWVNGPLIDPVFDPLQPEAILYEPMANGSLRLIGVEYIVINTGQERPTFAGHPMDVGGVPPLEAQGVAHWSLHVWAHLDNPSGMFAPFNPNVSCDHAAHAG
ncbi:hypothetical protein BH23BAC4_BH23BAC4_17290 [soil metagenome]